MTSDGLADMLEQQQLQGEILELATQIASDRTYWIVNGSLLVSIANLVQWEHSTAILYNSVDEGPLRNSPTNRT